MERSRIIIAILIGIVILSGVQVIEIMGMKSELVNGVVQGSTATRSDSNQQTRYSSAPSSPSMVGGC